MTLEEFTDFLDRHGVAYHMTTNSVVLNHCPSCNDNRDKVWLYQDRPAETAPFFGKCLRCETLWNSRTYLEAVGVDPIDVKKLHGFDGELNLNLLPAIDPLGKKDTKSVVEPEPVDTSNFVPITSWMDHPAAQYAIKRGFVPEHADKIVLDYQASAVVFLVKNDRGQPIGYQRRFLRPPFPDLKVMSSVGFKKLEWILEFPNTGDICVCEGPFTALSAWHYGYHAVCTFGCEVGEAQLAKISNLQRNTGKDVAVAFDLDDAGRKGYRKVSLAIFWEGAKVYRVRPEVGNDLNDSWQNGAGVVVIDSSQEDVTVPDLGLDRNVFMRTS